MDCKRRRTGADTNAVSHTDGDSASYSSRTAASNTRTSPDILISVAGSRTVILAEEGISAPARCESTFTRFKLNRLASATHFASNRSVTFLLHRLIGFAAVA